MMHTGGDITGKLIQWAFSIGTGFIIAVETSFPFFVPCLLITALDVYSAYELGRRLHKKWPDKFDGKFKSEYKFRIMKTMIIVFIAIILGSYVDQLMLDNGNEAVNVAMWIFIVCQGVRTAGRQQELYAQGRTKPGAIVTNVDGVVKKSNHQPKADGYGYAVDLYPFVGSKVNVNAVKELKALGEHIVSVAKEMNTNVEWGGNWKMCDYPHFELKGL